MGHALLARQIEYVNIDSHKYLANQAEGKKNCTGHFRFQRNLLQIADPLAHILKLANQSSCIPWALFKLLLLWFWPSYLTCCLCKSKDLVSYHPPVLPELSLASFQNQMLWGLRQPVMSLLFVVSHARCLVPDCLSAPPILFDSDFSLQPALEVCSASLQVVYRVSCTDVVVSVVCLWNVCFILFLSPLIILLVTHLIVL